MQFGQELREQRERRGISLDDVASRWRISARHLDALEHDRFAELPGGVFNRGIVRSYAQHCGLDTNATLRKFEDAMRASGFDTEGREDDWQEFAQAVRRSRTVDPGSPRIRWAGVMGMIVAVLLLATGVAWLLVHRGVVHLPEKKRILAVGHIL